MSFTRVNVNLVSTAVNASLYKSKCITKENEIDVHTRAHVSLYKSKCEAVSVQTLKIVYFCMSNIEFVVGKEV